MQTILSSTYTLHLKQFLLSITLFTNIFSKDSLHIGKILIHTLAGINAWNLQQRRKLLIVLNKTQLKVFKRKDSRNYPPPPPPKKNSFSSKQKMFHVAFPDYKKIMIFNNMLSHWNVHVFAEFILVADL